MKTMKDYMNFCTAEQTRRAYVLGAPIRMITNIFNVDNGEQFYRDNLLYVCMGDFCCVVPTTQQVINWLREEKHLSFGVIDGCVSNIKIKVVFGIELIYEKWGETKENVLASIDAAFDYLEKQSK